LSHERSHDHRHDDKEEDQAVGVARREWVRDLDGQRHALRFEEVGEGSRDHAGRGITRGARHDQTRLAAKD
jgi:hypothetical protein